MPFSRWYKLTQFYSFAQSDGNEHIRKFDHGSRENLEKYGTEDPPKYDFSKITVPVYEFIGTNDWLSTVQDAQAKVKEMQTAKIYLIDEFDHLEFIRGARAKAVLHPQILHILRNKKTFVNNVMNWFDKMVPSQSNDHTNDECNCSIT